MSALGAGVKDGLALVGGAQLHGAVVGHVVAALLVRALLIDLRAVFVCLFTAAWCTKTSF